MFRFFRVFIIFFSLPYLTACDFGLHEDHHPFNQHVYDVVGDYPDLTSEEVSALKEYRYILNVSFDEYCEKKSSYDKRYRPFDFVEINTLCKKVDRLEVPGMQKEGILVGICEKVFRYRYGSQGCEYMDSKRASDKLFKEYVSNGDYKSYSCKKIKKLVCDKKLCNLHGNSKISCNRPDFVVWGWATIYGQDYFARHDYFGTYVIGKCNYGSSDLIDLCGV